MGKRGRPLEGSERAEQNDSHSEAQAVQITDGEVGAGLQGGGEEGLIFPDCSCPHLPPYKKERPVSTDIFNPTPRINVKNFIKSVDPFPDGMRYYTTISECQGTKKNGKPCDKKLIENMYLPLTRLSLPTAKISKENIPSKHSAAGQIHFPDTDQPILPEKHGHKLKESAHGQSSGVLCTILTANLTRIQNQIRRS